MILGKSEPPISPFAGTVLTICTADTRNQPDDPTQQTMIPLTVNEIRPLINTLIIRPIRDHTHRVRGSHWRRQHQARAH